MATLTGLCSTTSESFLTNSWFSLCSVTSRTEAMTWTPLSVCRGGQLDIDADGPPVLGQGRQIGLGPQIHAALALEKTFELVLMPGAYRQRHQQVDVLAEQRLATVAERNFRPWNWRR